MSYLRNQPEADLKTVLKSQPDMGVPFAVCHEVLLRGPSPFSIAERELMAAYVSGLNACEFCAGEHDAVAQRFGIPAGLLDALLADVETAPVSDEMRAAFRYLRKLTLQPARICGADADAIYAAGWKDEALYHLAGLCGLFAFDNRLIQGLGIAPHAADKLQETADRLHARGYTSTVEFIKGE